MSQSFRSRTTPTTTTQPEKLSVEVPLLDAPETPKSPPPPPTLTQQAISQTLTTTANLANLLPTGTLLAFNLLTPIFTNNGACNSATAPLTLSLLALLAISCFLHSFTDSVSSSDGKGVYYGIATLNGMFLFDCPDCEACAGLKDLRKYRIRVLDVVHGVLSVLVFGAFALKDKNVLNCFYPMPIREIAEVLNILPIGVGVICSLLFTVFPTTRHGIGYPVTPAK